MTFLIAQFSCNFLRNKNMVELIKEHFLSKKEYPFPSTDYWKWFRYTRHSDFKRYLNKDKFYNHLVWDDIFLEQVGHRKRECIRMSRPFFYDLAVRYHPGIKERLLKIYADCSAGYFRSRYHSFRFSKKKEYRHRMNIYMDIKGNFYTRPLTTKSLAEDLKLCPYEVFSFCSKKFCTRQSYPGSSVVEVGHQPIPIVYFDSIHHSKRYSFILFLKLFAEKYPLDECRKAMLAGYLLAIEELLDKQIEHDIKAGRLGKKKRRRVKGTLTEKEMEELKKLFRQGSFLCHPDTSMEDGTMFGRLKEAFDRKDLLMVRRIYFTLNQEKTV